MFKAQGILEHTIVFLVFETKQSKRITFLSRLRNWKKGTNFEMFRSRITAFLAFKSLAICDL